MLAMKVRLLRALIREALDEGGLKLAADKRLDLTPDLVRRASAMYLDFINDWNAWLERRGERPVEPQGPSGSAAHAEQDIIDRPETVYGDVDYLVSFPVDYEADDVASKRKAEAASEKKYTDLMAKFISSTHPKQLDPELSLHGTPLQVIVKLGPNTLVQVDTTVTHPESAEWMKGRYVPERGIKGYVSGKLYKALGDYLTLTIGTEGVLVRTKAGKRVGGNVRAGVDIRRISNNFRTFIRDIADYLAPGIEPHPLLTQHPGLDPSAVSISDFAAGIVGLAETLDAAGVASRDDMLREVLALFKDGLDEAVDKKASRDITPEKQAKLRKLNAEQYDRVRGVFGL